MWTVYRFKPTLILQNFSSNTKAGTDRTYAIDESGLEHKPRTFIKRPEICRHPI